MTLFSRVKTDWKKKFRQSDKVLCTGSTLFVKTGHIQI